MSDSLERRIKVWVWGLLVAVVSSVGDAGAAFLVAPKLIEQHWRELWPVLAFTTLKAGFLYVKQYPLPALEDSNAPSGPEQIGPPPPVGG